MKAMKIMGMATALAFALTLASCHTTEANYKAAYDKAVEKTRQNRGLEWEEKQADRVRANTVIDGDSVRVKRYHFNVVDDKPAVAKKYAVVTGEFQQKFNAMSMRDRYRKEGHQSYVVYHAKEKTYFVVVNAYDDLAVAAAFIRIMKDKTKVKPTVPRPWVLEKM
jgi:hypothetical protein